MMQLLPGHQPPPNATIVQQIRRRVARFGSFVFGPHYPRGSTERTQVYLIMSHDSNQAVLKLKNNKPSLEFLGVARSEHLKELNALMAKMTHAMGGTFVNNPFYAAFNEQEVTSPIGLRLGQTKCVLTIADYRSPHRRDESKR